MNDQPSPFFRILIVMACVVIVVLGIRAANSIVTPILFTLIIGLFAIPVQLALIRRRVPPLVAFLGVFAVAAILIILTLLAFSILAAAVQASMVDYQAQLAAQVDALAQALAQRGISIAPSADLTSIETQVFSGTSAMLEALATSLSSGFLVILILFFLLMDAPHILGRVANSPGAQTALFENAVGYFGEVRGSLYRMSAINLAQGIYITVVLLAFGVDFAVLWGL